MKKILLILLFIMQLLFCFATRANTVDEVRLFLDNNEPAKALKLLSTFDGDNLSAEVEFLLADAFLRSNKIEKSIKHAIKAVELDPKSSESHMIFAESQGLKLANGDGGILKKLGLVKRVRKSFEYAVQLDPNNIRARSGLSQFYLMAPGIAGGSKKKALIQAQAIFATDKKMGYPILAQVYRSTKKLTETLNSWHKDFPNDWNAVISIARFEQDLNNHAKSFELLNNWLSNKPLDVAAQYQLGRLAATTGNYLEQGENSLLSYLQVPVLDGQPGYQWAHYRLAMVYQHQNKLDLAKNHVKQGLTLDADNKELLALRAKL